MYGNFSALKTNMAIYLSPFQCHLTFSTSWLALRYYIRGSEYSSGKKYQDPPPKPRPYKALAVNGTQRLKRWFCLFRP